MHGLFRLVLVSCQCPFVRWSFQLQVCKTNMTIYIYDFQDSALSHYSTVPSKMYHLAHASLSQKTWITRFYIIYIIFMHVARPVTFKQLGHCLPSLERSKISSHTIHICLLKLLVKKPLQWLTHIAYSSCFLLKPNQSQNLGPD